MKELESINQEFMIHLVWDKQCFVNNKTLFLVAYVLSWSDVITL